MLSGFGPYFKPKFECKTKKVCDGEFQAAQLLYVDTYIEWN